MAKLRVLTVLSAAAMLSMGVLCRADVMTIDFDEPLPGGLVADPSFFAGTAAPSTSFLSNQYESDGALFSTVGGLPEVSIIDLGAGHAPTGNNGIGALSTAGNLDYFLPVDITFVAPGTTTAAVTDSVSIVGDDIPSFGQVYFAAYDINGNLIQSGQVEDEGDSVFSITAAGIHSFQIYSQNGDVAYDHLQFGTPVVPDSGPPIGPTATPEPASVAMVGLPVVLLAAWRRKRALRARVE